MYDVFFLILIKRTCKVTTEVRITIRVKILNLYSRRWLFFISGIAGHENIDMILNHLQKFNPTQRFRPALSLGGSFANLRTMMSKAGRWEPRWKLKMMNSSATNIRQLMYIYVYLYYMYIYIYIYILCTSFVKTCTRRCLVSMSITL